LYSNCFRGQQNTTAASHADNSVVYWEQVPAITVWPTPDNAQTYQLVYWRLRRTQDAGGGVNVMDVPFRFIALYGSGVVVLHVPERFPLAQSALDS
jgi:hypothetical protein